MTTIGVLLIKEITNGQESWVAQGLHYDIAAQGKTAEAAKDAFDKVVTAHIDYDVRSNRTPLASLKPAPQQFWDMFEIGLKINDPLKPLNTHAPARDFQPFRQVLAVA